MTTQKSNDVPGSFRDPSGFLFWCDGLLYRQVNLVYKQNYDHLIKSGLYQFLVDAGLLISHDEVDAEPAQRDKAYKIIRPELIPFISYPYEWCFSQLKEAALATLKIQRTALNYGMSLKDCSAYNIQFRKGKPVLIDTLSFEKYRKEQPWVAYRQFCQHYLAPLAIMACRDIRLNQLLRLYIDGIPLDLASSLLPFRTRLRLPLLIHIHLHSRSQKHFAEKQVDISRQRVSRLSLLGLIDNLESAVAKLKWRPQGTEWVDYYEDVSYSPEGFEHKKQIVAEFLDKIRPGMVWDLGANLGIFSRIASEKGIQTISFDIDPAAVERNYLQCATAGETNILPLIVDLTNPSSGIGWANRERMSFIERGPADAVLALALVHHLAISNNVPLSKVAEFFSNISNWLIIEFIPKTDRQVQRLLTTREDIFPEYASQNFEAEFSKFFAIQCCAPIRDSERTLYLMQRK